MTFKKFRPKKIKVMGKDYSFVWVSECVIDHENLGQTDHKKLTISIQDYQLPVEEGDTVLHEILHAIWHQMAIDQGPMEEEPIVRRMATGLFQVYLDNPDLLKYFSAIKNVKG